MLGKLLLAVGEENLLWGTDSVWYGPCQPLIDAFRAFRIPERLCQEHGYPPLTRERKVKKDEPEALNLALARTPDILAEVGKRKGSRIVVGFAAEDSDVAERALDKLRRKSLDLIVGNDISRPDRGFAAADNEVVILAADGVREEVSKRPKGEVAARILDQVERLLAARSA